MAIYYLADVQDATEHKAFRRTVRRYPDCSYSQWLHLREKDIGVLLSSKHKVRLVRVTAKEFLDYCDRTGIRCDVDTLTGFLWDRGKRLGVRRPRVT